MPGNYSTPVAGVQISVAEVGVIQSLITDYLEPTYLYGKEGGGVDLTQQELDFYFGEKFRPTELMEFHQQFQTMIMGNAQFMCLGEEFQVELNAAQAAFARSVLLFSQRIKQSSNPHQAKVLSQLLSKIDVPNYADFVASGEARRFRQHQSARRRWAGMGRTQVAQAQKKVISHLSMTMDFYERAIKFALKRLSLPENSGVLDRNWLQSDGVKVIEELRAAGIYLWLVEGNPTLQEVEAAMEEKVAPLLLPEESIEKAEIEVLRVLEASGQVSSLVIFVESTSPYRRAQSIEIDWVFITNLTGYFKVLDYPLETQKKIRDTLRQARQKGLGFYAKQALIVQVAIFQLQYIQESLMRRDSPINQDFSHGRQTEIKADVKSALFKRVVSELEKLQQLHGLLSHIDKVETHFGKAYLSYERKVGGDRSARFSSSEEVSRGRVDIFKKSPESIHKAASGESPEMNAAFRSLVDDISDGETPTEQAVLDFAARLITSQDRPAWATDVDTVIFELQNQGPHYEEIRHLTGDYEHFDRIMIALRRFGSFVSGSRRHRRSKQGRQIRH